MSAAARGGESLRRFRARLESRSTYPGRQSQRLEAASAVEAAAAVLSTDCGRRVRTPPRLQCGGTESAAARAADSLPRFSARTESRDRHSGRRSKRLEAASDVEGADLVRSAGFDRLNQTEPKVRRGGTESAAARAADSLRQFSARTESCVRHPERRGKRLEAASDVGRADLVLDCRFQPTQSHGTGSASLWY